MKHRDPEGLRKWLVRAGRIAALALGVAEGIAHAADPQTVGALFNWYYAASFGTGVYRIGTEQITVLAAPFGYTLREASEEQFGIRIVVPASAAVANFDLTRPSPGDIEKIDIAALSLLPGVELTIPMSPDWRLRPFANLGRGYEFQTDSAATIYQVGISSLYRFAQMRAPEISLGAKITYAGYRVSGEDATPIAAVSAGVSTVFPLRWTIGETGRHTNIGAHLIATTYATDLEFRLTDPTYRQVHWEYEAGLTFGVRPAFELWGAKFDRFGLGYVVGNGNLRGVRLVTEFPF